MLVAGGGVAGLTAAAAFASAGFRALCVDPVPPVTSAESEGSDLRSTAFLMPALALLGRAGLTARLEPIAAPLRVMRIVDAGGTEGRARATADFVAEEAGSEIFGWNLPNWLLRREMVARLAELPSAELRPGVRVERVTPRTTGAIVALSGGAQVRAALVIAADGRDSAVRRGLGSARGAGATARRRWSSPPPTTCRTTASRPKSTARAALYPGPPARSRRRAAFGGGLDGARTARSRARRPSRRRPGRGRHAAELRPLRTAAIAGGRGLWPIVSQVADRLDGPRTALVAEAAHVVPPIGAQGLNMSLGDIATLLDLALGARAAGADIGAPALLARYHRMRHGDMLLRVAGIDLLNRAAMAGAPPLRDLRALGLRPLHGFGPLRRGAMRLGLESMAAG